MKRFRLRIITENQNNKEKAQKTADLISEIIKEIESVHIQKYYKFENSFELEFLGKINEKGNSVFHSIELTSRLCSPWIVSLSKENNEVELIFNKEKTSMFSNVRLNIIEWAHFEIE